MISRNSLQIRDANSLPLSNAELQQYRLQLDRRVPTVPPGERLMRKRGQSLEFREYDAYQPGDDVRFIDWRLSLSRGAPWEMWKKTFDTEEAARIVVSVDQSATLDAASGKSTIAAWLAEAVSRVALLGRDHVVLHRMWTRGEDEFASGTDSAWRGRLSELRGPAAVAGLRDQFGDSADAGSRVGDSTTGDLSSVVRFLKPGVIWLIVSDFLAPPECLQQLAASVSAARQRRAVVAVIELDSWPWERARIAERPVRVAGPGIGLDEDRLRFDVQNDLLERITQKIDANRDTFFRRVPLGSLRSRWAWPVGGTRSSQLDLKTLFRDWFTSDSVVSDLLIPGGTQ